MESSVEVDQFRQVIERMPIAMVMVDGNGLIELVNPQAVTTFGYSATELLGQSIDRLLPEWLQSQHREHPSTFGAMASACQTSDARKLLGRRKSGSEFPAEISFNSIATSDGVKGLAAIVDISQERARADKLLGESEQRFRKMIEGVTDYAIITLDTSGHVDSWNRGAERLKGYRDHEILGQHFSRFYTQDDVENGKPVRELEEVTATGRYEEQGWRVRKDGSRFLAYVVMAAVRDEAGQLRGFTKVTRDVTKEKQAQDQLNKMIRELKRSNEEMNSFAYVASHDLKSPLHGISQLATWITEDMGDQIGEETREHLRLLRSRVGRMESLLDDLLSYARAGRISESSVAVDTNELVQDIFELNAAAKSLKLEVAEGLPVLHTARAPLELVFRNLISNAIKHHHKPEGTIRISAQPIADGFEFAVRDDGPGIAPEHQERVFGMFQTLRPRDEVEGSGIGLALVKKTIESIGGRLALESDGKNGCTFLFTWPTTLVTV